MATTSKLQCCISIISPFNMFLVSRHTWKKKLSLRLPTQREVTGWNIQSIVNKSCRQLQSWWKTKLLQHSNYRLGHVSYRHRTWIPCKGSSSARSIGPHRILCSSALSSKLTEAHILMQWSAWSSSPEAALIVPRMPEHMPGRRDEVILITSDKACRSNTSELWT